MTASTLQRRVDFRPGYDKRDQVPNCGIDGGSLWWTVTGPRGAVSFEMLTNWYPESVSPALAASGPRMPLAGQLTWHRPADQAPRDAEAAADDMVHDQCDFLNGPCRFHSCYSCATPVLEVLLTGGSDALWVKLETLYREEFEPGEVSA